MTAAGSDGRVNLQIGNSIAEMTKVVDFVDRFGAEHRLSQGVTDDLNLCLDEILNNTISYGYDGHRPGCICVSLWISDGLVVAEVQDDGKPFDPWKADLALPTGGIRTRTLGGVGIHFVKTLMDEVDYSRRGNYNVIKIMKKWSKG